MEFYPTFVASRPRKVAENFKFETERHTSVDVSVTYMWYRRLGSRHCAAVAGPGTPKNKR